MFPAMRRFKQQLPEGECIEILKTEPRGVLSLLGRDGYPYGIPMNHVYCEADGKLYFHCAKEGHKLEAIRGCDKVSFCVYDQGYREPGDWPLNIRSVVVFGRIRIVEEPEKMAEVCRSLGYKFTAAHTYADSLIPKHLQNVLCLELTPEHITGKLVNES